MTRITVVYEGDRIGRLIADGHAGNAAQGENVACAAVSALMITCVNALEKIAGLKPDTVVNDGQGLIGLTLAKADGEAEKAAQIILRTTVLGLTDISHEYPKLVTLNIQNGRNKP